MVAELSSGPLVALLVSGPGAVQRMRELAGPRDVAIARHIRCVREWCVLCVVPPTSHARAHWRPPPAICTPTRPRPRACSPQSLRARYGESTAKPALHVTDLPEDGPLEAEAVFPALALL
jgi:nucleoside diphosphate kinase